MLKTQNCTLWKKIQREVCKQIARTYLMSSLRHLFFWSSWNRKRRDTIGQNRKKLRKNSYLIINIPTSLRVSEVSERTSERRGVREWSKQCGASEQVSGVSKWTSKWPSTYISIFDYSDPQCESEAARYYILPNWSPRMSFTLKFNRLTNLVPP